MVRIRQVWWGSRLNAAPQSHTGLFCNSNKFRFNLIQKCRIKTLLAPLRNKGSTKANITHFLQILVQLECKRTTKDCNNPFRMHRSNSSQLRVFLSCPPTLPTSQSLFLSKFKINIRGKKSGILTFPPKSRMVLTVTALVQLKRVPQIDTKAHCSLCPKMPIWSLGCRLWTNDLKIRWLTCL